MAEGWPSLADVYAAVLRIEGRLEVLAERQDATGRDVADHNTRLRQLEGRRWPLPAAGLLVSLLAALVAAAAMIRGGTA